jgi:hypothetical protein
MNTHKGFTLVTALFIVVLAAALGGAYVRMNSAITPPVVDDGIQTEPGDHMEVDHAANEGVITKTSITWQYKDAGEVDGMPHTTVTVVINGTAYEAGTFLGSCSEIGTTGGIDGKGLLAGELSATQCWFAGGGNEVGVFAHEDGGFDIMVGELSEGNQEIPFFRGNFTVKSTVRL